MCLALDGVPGKTDSALSGRRHVPIEGGGHEKACGVWQGKGGAVKKNDWGGDKGPRCQK